jgi:hypothetical protein
VFASPRRNPNRGDVARVTRTNHSTDDDILVVMASVPPSPRRARLSGKLQDVTSLRVNTNVRTRVSFKKGSLPISRLATGGENTVDIPGKEKLLARLLDSPYRPQLLRLHGIKVDSDKSLISISASASDNPKTRLAVNELIASTSPRFLTIVHSQFSTLDPRDFIAKMEKKTVKHPRTPANPSVSHYSCFFAE